MSDRMKELLTPLAVFIAGFAPAYYANPEAASWPRWVMAGLVALGAWITGYSQTNPRLQPTTSAQLLESVKKSDMPASVKAEVAAPLATEAAKPEKKT